MKSYIIAKLIGQILALLTPELLRSFADHIIEFLEAKVLGSASKVDDALLLPILKMMDIAFGLPDDVDVTGKKVCDKPYSDIPILTNKDNE